MGFRALAVHVLSVLPVARSNSLGAGLVQILAAAPGTNAGRQPERPIKTPAPSPPALHRKSMSSLMDALAASSAPVTASTPDNCASSPGSPGTWYCSPAASPGWPARRSQAMSVYLLAVVWG